MLSIIRNNNATFYNYRNGKPVKRHLSLLLCLLVAALLTVGFRLNLEGFLGSVATAQSILVGFSFSVMFFLVSADPVLPPKDANSLEKRLKYKKLTKLVEELFYNVSYFNLVAICCVLASIALMLPIPSVEFVKPWLMEVLNAEGVKGLAVGWSAVRQLFYLLLLFVFYFAMLESIVAFYRTALRVSYFFEEKLKYDEGNRG